MSVEHVLVIPTQVFRDTGYFQGFSSEVDRYLKVILDPQHASYRPRPEMEQDPEFKQLIPYCIFRYGDQIFQYQRGNDQGESRLHAKYSVGVGGHVSTEDLDGDAEPYLEGMRRELEEEISIEAKWTETCTGLINDDETEVGRVHLGIVHVFELESPEVQPREKSMVNSGFVPLPELLSRVDEFETWSQICLQHLAKGE
ncbi:MAG: phosphoesterase [Planctomycetaceae bacterium]